MKVRICGELHFTVEVKDQEELERRLQTQDFDDSVISDVSGEVYKIEGIIEK